MINDSWLYVHAGVGAILLWAKMRREQRKVYALTGLTDKFIQNERLRLLTEVVVFVSLGSYVTITVFWTPTMTAGQAFAAGLGWTAGLTSNK